MPSSPVGWPVFVVDDDDLARELVINYLRKLHLVNPIVTARDGEEACAMLADAPYTPALVLLDLDMPRATGLDVLRWMRGERALARVPVVMLTASAGIGEVDEAFDLGISSYLVKPVGFAALQDMVTRIGIPWALAPATEPE